MADNKGKKKRIAFNPYWVYGFVAVALIVISTFFINTAVINDLAYLLIALGN